MPTQYCNFIKLNDTQCICSNCKYPTTHCKAKRECGINEVVAEQATLQPPPLLQRLINFSIAATNHAIAGNPVVTEEVLQQRLAICRSCPLFKSNENTVGGVCTHESCGCNIQDNLNYLNKIAWQDQNCPINKWNSVYDKDK